MLSKISCASVMLLLASGIHAHYTVQHPPTIQPFDDDGEGEGPCGGYTPSPDDLKTNDFHVDGDAIGTTLTHPEATWLYRITTDLTAKGNWTEVYPIFSQKGAGAYCQPSVTIPHEYIGQKAILGMIAKAVDGMLYQCSAVQFVAGTAEKPGDCNNATGVQATYTSDPALASQTGSPETSSTGTSDAANSEHSPSAAISGKSHTMQGLGALLTVGTMVVLGAALMI